MKFISAFIAATLIAVGGSLAAPKFFGGISFTSSGNQVNYYIQEIYNDSTIRTTGSIRIQVYGTWAPYGGAGLLYGTLLYDTPNDLSPIYPGYAYNDLADTISFSDSPTNYSYLVVFMAEWNGSSYVRTDYRNIPVSSFLQVYYLAPSITSHPSGATLNSGSTANFSVTATGTNLSYQWRKNGTPISGAKGSAYTIPSAKASDAGNYTVTVANSAGTVTSNVAVLKVNTPPPVVPPPSITAQPKSLLVVTGASARFAVTATGKNLTYQWNKNGSPIKGATGASFNISSVKAADAGNYTVAVTNSAKRVTSAVAKLTVNAPKITSNLSAVNLQLNRLMPRYTVTANFVATSYSAQGLPAGLKFDAGRGVVSGSPTQKGSYTVTFTAAKKQGTKVIHSATAKKVIKVN